jgi:hypothetical protein
MLFIMQLDPVLHFNVEVVCYIFPVRFEILFSTNYSITVNVCPSGTQLPVLNVRPLSAFARFFPLDFLFFVVFVVIFLVALSLLLLLPLVQRAIEYFISIEKECTALSILVIFAVKGFSSQVLEGCFTTDQTRDYAYNLDGGFWAEKRLILWSQSIKNYENEIKVDEEKLVALEDLC